MDQLYEINTTKRQAKNEETRKKLCRAMDEIMNQYDYNTVTIRNICKVSGVAYGSFYNLFESKENFLQYYLSNDFAQYMEKYYQDNDEFNKLNSLEKCIDIFVCCAQYNVEKGLKFISGFYSTGNGSLFPDIDDSEKESSFTLLIQKGREYLTASKEEGLLSLNADIEKTIHMCCYLFNGVTFNWCISKGHIDMTNMVKKVLHEYISFVNEDKHPTDTI